MVDHLEMCMDFQKGGVMMHMVHISHTHFDIWNGLLKMVDIRYTCFDVLTWRAAM